MSGKLYALSTGPGAADLITVRAARVWARWTFSTRPPDVKAATASRSPSCGSISANGPKCAAAISR